MKNQLMLKINLEKLMDEHGIKAPQLAKITGVSKSTINNWLSNQRPSNLIALKKVASFFNSTVDNILFDSGSPQEIKIGQFGQEVIAGEFQVSIILKPLKKE